MVRKSTVHRNPIGSTSEAQQKQRSRQSMRRHIMQAQADGLTMNTETLLEFNPKLSEVTHTTRVAYAKFMSTKIKKEIKFEVEVENEKVRARETKAFNKFKMNAGILKKAVQASAEEKTDSPGEATKPIASTSSQAEEDTSKDFRARTPIEEDPNEGLQTPDRPSTPENILDEPVPKISASPIPTPSPVPQLPVSPAPSNAHKPDSPMLKPKSLSFSPDSAAKSPEPPVIKAPENPIEEAEEDEEEEEEKPEKSPKPSKDSVRLNVPTTTSRPSSPSIGLSTGDKGKSKITGKTLTGWI